MKGKREKYIDGMKGYACLFILLGHFMGIYKYAENADMIDSWFVRILTIGPLSFFSAESYWLYLFLVISGYLLMTFNTPHNYKEFVIKCAKRALRFVIPVIGTAIFIYILQGVIGFYNFDVQSIVQNKWLTNLYENPLTLKEVLEEPILVLVYGKSKFNSPFWCIRDMFISAVLIYAINIKEKTVERKSFWIIVFIILFCLLKRNVIIACLIGAFTGLLKQNQYIQKISGNIPYFSIVFLIVAFIVNNSLLIDFSFAMLLLCIPKMKWGGRLLESKIGQNLGKISFGIYALHWPVINSIGLKIVVEFTGKIRKDVIMIMALLVTIGVTLLLAKVFRETVERMTTKICGLIQ